ncbi:MAG: 2-amino-4-hydroxy-6-hydroxymethyldihydropteridine diphosphokinase [Pseudomonadota bacterium]
MTRAAIGLGCNLDAGRALKPALRALARIPRTTLLASSSIYRSAPWGGARGGSFFNAAAIVDTVLSPWQLLRALRDVERALGRLRGPHYGPRRIDLDLLCMDGVRLATPRLSLPHPQLLARRFVLQPLCDIAPTLVVAPGLCVRAALQRCPDRGRLWQEHASDAP